MQGAGENERGGAGSNLLQSLQIAPTIAELEAACASSPIETNAYANTIAATNSFIVNVSFCNWNICSGAQRSEVTT